jgi:hypothetical protein
MADISVILSEIELKLRKLIDINSQLIEENKRLVYESEALKNENETLRQTNQELENKINKGIIVNALGNEKEIEEGRKLIKSLVKEIDQCVSILNSKE